MPKDKERVPSNPIPLLDKPLVGAFVWECMAGDLGVVTASFIQRTGKAYWWLMGLFASNTIMFIFVYGFFYALRAPRIVPWDLETNWTVLLENLVFGFTMSLLMIRWGDWSRPESGRNGT